MAIDINEVWEKGKIISGHDANVWRHDAYGHVIKYDQHGQLTEYGWEVDHITPVAKNGDDDIGNLRPLYWQANRQKSDN